MMSDGMWELAFWVVVGVLWAAAIFGGGALLLVGAKFIVKTPRATYWRCVWAMFLGTLGYAGIGYILSLFANMNPSLPVIGLIAGLFWMWLIIGLILKISFKESILAWLPVLVFKLLLGAGILIAIYIFLP